MPENPPPHGPRRPEDLFARLRELGIASTTTTHPPVFTVAEAKNLRGALPGAHIKNLFLRNKKGAMWLVVCPEDRRIDLKALGAALGAGRFSFGSAARLRRHLGVPPGSVTPFAVINDQANLVRVVLDSDLLTGDPINCHPLVNHMTTAIAPEDLMRFLEAERHAPKILDLGELCAAPAGAE